MSYSGYASGPPHAQGQPPPPPNLPYGWRAEWVHEQRHYLYINEQTGRRQFEFPGGQPPNAPGYHRGPPPPQGYGPPPPGYGGPRPGQPPQQQQQQGGHNWKDMAMGGAGGALLGGFLTHEWDEHKERRKEDEWRREERGEEDEIARLRRENQNLERRDEYDRERRDEYRDDNVYVENTYIDERRGGDYIQEDTFVERRDDVVYEDDSYRRDDYGGRDQGLVADVVDDVAGWAGREEGRVERFGDDVQESFDDGRDYERYDDRY